MSLQGFYTSKGLALAARVAAGAGLTVTRVTAGNGETAKGAAALAQEQQTLTAGTAAISGESAVLPVTLAETSVTAAYSLTELGVYATDPTEGEILYQVFRLDESRNIQAGGENVYRFCLKQTVGAAGITVTCSPAGLLVDEDLAPLRRAMAKKPDAQLTYTILHVAKTGSDETGDGSADRPFLTIQKALDSFPKLLMYDQIIQVAAGYYPEKLSIWGFLGGQISLTAEEGAEVSVDSITVGACVNREVRIDGITLVGSTVEFPGNAFRVFGATMIELINITCTGTEATPQVGAFYLCNCPCLSIRNSSISNKGIALDVMGSIVYLNNTVTGVNNTVGIRCGSGWGSKGGYVQKGGATIAGEEQKEFGGQIW